MQGHGLPQAWPQFRNHDRGRSPLFEDFLLPGKGGQMGRFPDRPLGPPHRGKLQDPLPAVRGKPRQNKGGKGTLTHEAIEGILRLQHAFRRPACGGDPGGRFPLGTFQAVLAAHAGQDGTRGLEHRRRLRAREDGQSSFGAVPPLQPGFRSEDRGRYLGNSFYGGPFGCRRCPNGTKSFSRRREMGRCGRLDPFGDFSHALTAGANATKPRNPPAGPAWLYPCPAGACGRRRCRGHGRRPSPPRCPPGSAPSP